MKKTLFSLAILCFVATSIFAQKKIKDQAHINYEITDIKSQDAMAAMMKGSTLDIYVTEGQSHSSMNIMQGMMKMDVYSAKKGEKPVSLMQMMGNKIKIVGTDDIAANAKDKKPEFVVNKKKTKEIAGYKCYEAKAKMDDGVVITMYFTDKIELKPGEGVNVFGMGFDSVDGFPLEFDMSSKDGGMTITAKKVEDKVDTKVFKYDDTGYKEMTPEDLQKMGMGGMGF